MIPYGRQEITEADIEAVTEVLRSDFLTQGPAVPRFEREVAKYCGASHAVAVNSATSALHIACLALGVRPGDRVWTSPITFVASANCALYCGAEVGFVDIDPRTCNLSVERLGEKLARAEAEGMLPRVVIPVHFAGEPCDMEAIHRLSERYGFRIIEDASHAIGGRYRGEPIGSCRFSDVTVFSFHPVKIITTGEGGVAVTNDSGVARRMERLRTHGITRDADEMTHAPDGSWYYQQLELGFNYRITDMQAALGVSQLGRLDALVERRHRLADRYDDLLRGFPLVTPWRDPENYSGLHLYVVRLRLDEISRSRRDVFVRLREAGVGVNVHYIPVYRQPYYSQFGIDPSGFPEAERYYATAISIPMYPALTTQQQDYVISALRAAVSA